MAHQTSISLGIQCLLCHFELHRLNRPWQCVYRALHATSKGVELTGVGSLDVELTDRDFFPAPLDRNKRWDTMGKDYIILAKAPYWRENTILFHEACWDQLTEHFGAEHVDLNRLFAECKRLPEPQDVQRLLPNHQDRYDPYELPSNAQFMQAQKKIPKPTKEIAKREAIKENKSDIFRLLPVEIREIIAAHLPTKDFLSLRLVSRAMKGQFDSLYFWRTRFEINGERGFLSHLLELYQGNRQIFWRRLYHSTCKMKCSRVFDFRIQTWERARWLYDATTAKESNSILDFGGRALQHYHNTFYPNVSRKETATIIPSMLKTIGVSALHDGGSIHITGMEFFFTDKTSKRIGYTTQGVRVEIGEIRRPRPSMLSPNRRRQVSQWRERPNEEIYAYPGVQMRVNGKGLNGFLVQSGLEGIHTIQVVRCSVGRKVVGGILDMHAPIQYHSMTLDEVTEVIATFDHQHRMIELGIRGRGERRDLHYGGSREDRDIFDMIDNSEDSS